MPTSITTIQNTDLISASNETINDNFTSVNSNKIETSTLDTDGTLAANSDAKIATQKAVKTYVDTSVNLKQTLTQTSELAPTVDTDIYGLYILTGQVVDITSMTTNLSGSPVDGDEYRVRITNGISAMSFVVSAEYADASSDTAVVDKPAGTSDGDIMFMVIESGTAYQNALPDGWTSIAQQTSTDFYELAYKVADSEGSNYTVTFAAAQPVKVTILTYNGGFNQSDPIDVFSSTAYVASDTNNRAASMNVTYANSPLMFFGCVQGASAITQTKPSTPTTDWVEDYDSGDTDSGFWLEVCSMTWTGKGATGAMTSTLSSSATNKHAFAVALKPAIEITWGNNFDEYLQGVVLPGETKYYDLQYNSASLKWSNSFNRDIPVIKKYEVLTLGDATTQYDVTNPAGTTFRFTYDGTGTNPSINSTTLPIGSYVHIPLTFASGNRGNFTTTGVGSNYFEVTNASGAIESNRTGIITARVSHTWTKKAGLRYVTVEVVGGGSHGSPETDSDSSNVAGSGGNAAGYAKKIISASDLSSTETVIVGAVTQDSSFGTFCYGNTVGTATGGDVNLVGQSGTISPYGSSGGNGGSTPLGTGGSGATAADTNGGAATGYGSGGGGGRSSGTPTGLGGLGAPGVVIVTEYYT